MHNREINLKIKKREDGNSPPKGLNGVVYVHGLHYLHLILRSADKKVDIKIQGIVEE